MDPQGLQSTETRGPRPSKHKLRTQHGLGDTHLVSACCMLACAQHAHAPHFSPWWGAAFTAHHSSGPRGQGKPRGDNQPSQADTRVTAKA